MKILKKHKNCIFLGLIIGVLIFLCQTKASAEILDSWEDSRAYRPKPILFLHGFAKGSPFTWDPAFFSLADYFDEYYFVEPVIPYSLPYLERIAFEDPNGSVDTYPAGKTNPQGTSDGWANKVIFTVNGLLSSDKYGNYTDKVNLVSHSMGGLAAREYLTNYTSLYGDKLITIGTPHLGSPLATFANSLTGAQRIGWFIPWIAWIFTNQVELLDEALEFFGEIDIDGEAIDDMDPSWLGSGFLDVLNSRSQPTEVDYYGIIGVIGSPVNWTRFLNYFGDLIVSEESQMGGGYVNYKDYVIIRASHFTEVTEATLGDENKILKFLDSTPPEIEITSPEDGYTAEGTTVTIKGLVRKEYLPADTILTVSIQKEGEPEPTVVREGQLLKPTNLWEEDDPDSPVAEFEEEIDVPPGGGTYTVITKVTNPAGISDESSIEILTGGKYGIIADAYISSEWPDGRFGTSGNLYVYSYEYDINPKYNVRRIFIKWNPSQFPSANNYYLNLYCNRVDWYALQGPVYFNIKVVKVLENWQERTITWNNAPSLGEEVSSITLEYYNVNTGTGHDWYKDFLSFYIGDASNIPYGVCIYIESPPYRYLEFYGNNWWIDPEKYPYIDRQ